MLNEKTNGVTDSERTFLTIDEISKHFGIPKQTLYNLTSTKKIRHYKPGKRLLFTIEDVNNYILSSVR